MKHVTVGSLLAGTFGFVRGNLRVVAIWIALYLVFAILMRLGLAPFYAAQAEAARAAAQGLPAPMPPVGSFAAIFLLLMLLMLVLYNAVFRAVLFPEDSAAAYLRVGMDEARLAGLVLLLFLMLFAGGVVGGFVIGVVGTILMVALGLGQAGGMRVFSLAMAVLWVVMVGFAIRLSIAAPLTLYRRQIVLGPAWRLARGRFWTLLGANLVVALLVFAMMLILMVPILGPMMAAMGNPADPDATRRLMELQAQQMQLDSGPYAMIWLLVSSLIGGLVVAVFGALPAVATRQLIEEQAGQL